MGIDKKYLDRQITAADPEDSKSSVRFVTTTALTTYNRVGNVITATANGALGDQDGVTPALGDSLLLTSDGSASDIDNGIYEVTQLGDGGSPFILTRRGDANANDLVTCGMNMKVEEGLLYAAQEFILVTANPITVNTTPLVFTQTTGGSGGPDNFSYNTIASTTVTVPDGQSMLVSQDIRLTDDAAELVIAGEVADVTSRDNHTIKYIPPRSTKVIHENDIMYYDPTDFANDGTLVIDGDLKPFPIIDGVDVLAALTEVAPDTPSILGTASPTSFLTPAQARAVMDVYSTAETDTAIVDGVAAELTNLGPFANLTVTAQSGDFTATAGVMYVVAQQGVVNGFGNLATLPAGPAAGDFLAFTMPNVDKALNNDFLRISGNGNNVVAGPELTAATVSVRLANKLVYARYTGTQWELFGSGDLADPALRRDGIAGLRGGTFTATANYHYDVSAGSAFTIFLPSSPKKGDRVSFSELGGGNNTITINGNGNSIQTYTGSSSATASVKGQGFRVSYIFNDAGLWSYGDSSYLHSRFGGISNSILVNDLNTGLTASFIGNNDLVGKVGSATIGPVGVGTNAVIGRAGSGDLTSFSFTEHTWLGRKATGATLGVRSAAEMWNTPSTIATATVSVTAIDNTAWNPSTSAVVVNVSSITPAGGALIRGMVFAAQTTGPIIRVIRNTTTDRYLQFNSEDTGEPTNANRFTSAGSVSGSLESTYLPPGATMLVLRDETIARWVIVGVYGRQASDQTVVGAGGTVAVNMDRGNNVRLVLNANTTFNFVRTSSAYAHDRTAGRIIIVQDGTGGWVPTFQYEGSAANAWEEGGSLTLTGTANSTDLVEYSTDGNGHLLLRVVGLNFS